MSKIKVYISHSIRGIKGLDATHEDMQTNNQKAIVFGEAMKKMFPNVEFYVPGDHDEFVMIGYEKRVLTEKIILDIDCEIIKSRHFILNFIPDQYISNGMLIENMYALSRGTPILMAKDVDAGFLVLKYALERLVT